MKAGKLAQILAYMVATILVLLPFHAFFTTWLGANFGHLDLFRIWKELLLVPIGMLALWLLFADKKTLKWLKQTRLFYVILAYIGLHLILGILALLRHQVSSSALLYALLANLRMPIFFVICLAVAVRSTWLQRHWQPIILVPAAIVVVFGLLQHVVLPIDWLRHFGYGPQTIPAYQTVDQKLAYVRLQSTLRGPNPLGAYLVLILSILGALWLKDKTRRLWWSLAIAASALVLFFTYSRSAWLGALIAAGVLLWRSFDQPRLKRWLVLGSAVILLLGVGSVLALRHNDRFQNTVFHTDEHSRSADSSNQDRAAALRRGLHDVVHEPWGRGPGTAGPASVRNTAGASRIAENYFLQLGQEVGVIGLLLFVGLCLIVGLLLWRQTGTLSAALFAALIGISLINLLSHAWMDDTLGLLWWGLAGIALAPAVTRRSRT